MNNEFFDIVTVPYVNMNWTYVETKKTLLSVIGIEESSGLFVAIRQFRPPINSYVYSLPMGAFPIDECDEDTLMQITKEECEGETGYKIKSISPYMSYYRSPGLTNERMIVYKAIYGELCNQKLHDDEDITPILLSKEDINNLIHKGEKIDSSLLLINQL